MMTSNKTNPTRERYAVLLQMKGGKELKFEDTMAPKAFPAIGKMELQEGVAPIVIKKPFDYDDELKKKLSVQGKFTTWLQLELSMPDVNGLDDPKIKAYLDYKLLMGDYVELKEKFYNVQVIFLEAYGLGS